MRPFTPLRALALGATPAVLLLGGGCNYRGAELEITPQVVSGCDTPAALQVRWDVSGLGLKYARIEVNNVGERPKAWMPKTDSRGEAETGGWAHDGFTITVRSMNGVGLARRTMEATPCSPKQTAMRPTSTKI